MKKLLAILLAMTMVLSLGACAQAPAAEAPADDKPATDAPADDAAETPAPAEGESKGSIIYVCKDTTSIWFISEAEAAQKIVEAAGYEWKFVNAEMDAATYMEQLNTAITDKAVGVMVCPPDQNLSQTTVELLEAAKIPVISVDDALIDAEGTKIAPWVGIDAFNIGRDAGLWAGDYILENNLQDDPSFGVMYMTGETISTCVLRTDGQEAGILEKVPDFPAERQFYGDGDTTAEEGNVAANAIITGHPEITKWLVISVSDEAAQGAARAVESAGLGADSITMGLGGYLCPDEFQNEDSCFKAAAYFSAKSVGIAAAKAMVAYLDDGVEMPMEFAVSAEIIEKGDDLAEKMPEYVS